MGRQRELAFPKPPIFVEVVAVQRPQPFLFESICGDATLSMIQAASYCIRNQLTPKSFIIVTP